MTRAALVCAALLAAISPVVCQQPGEIICLRAETPPTIDGVLDVGEWPGEPSVSSLTQPLSGSPVGDATRASVVRDDSALFIALECMETEPDRLVRSGREGSPDLWQDDCVEVWLRSGRSMVEVDQFIVNAGGAKVFVRSGEAVREPEWDAACTIGADRWVAEMRVPFRTLGVTPNPGRLLQLKLGREDRAGAELVLSTWPPGAPYAGIEGFGRLYLGDPNLLPNPAMMERREDGAAAGWVYGDDDAPLFSGVEADGEPVIRYRAPGRYSTASQTLRLTPESVYRLEAEVRGEGAVYLRARTPARDGESSTPYTVDSRPSDTFERLSVTFPTGESGEALIIIGNTSGHGEGLVEVRGLRVVEDVVHEAEGPAIPIEPGKPVRITKVAVEDCRALRGFIVSPVDGDTKTISWSMEPWEYGMGGGGAGVGYLYRRNDGLHITLADEDGVDAVQLRQRAKVKLYRDAEAYDAPGDAPLLWEFAGTAESCRALFAERVLTRNLSFFDLRDGLIADVSFLRADPCDMPELTQESSDDGRLSIPEGTGVAALALRLDVAQSPGAFPLTVVVLDPLHPHRELMRAELAATGPGVLEMLLDFPDQIIPAAGELQYSVEPGAKVILDSVVAQAAAVPREEALPEAVAYRRFLMRGLFSILSEPRPWNTFRRDMDLEAFYAENPWGAGVRELAETIDFARALSPEDDTIRCYDEWFWRRMRELPPFSPTLDDDPLTPRWANLARQAWLESRGVAEWWLDNRLVPTGEFGGLVNDDTCMYQNYADLVMFEDGGVAARLRDGAARLMELALDETLTDGLNRHTMDPLHAYEEGLNHESMLAWWNYGDPHYLELCMLSARNLPALTTVTPEGHRHFKSQTLGAEDLRIDREPDLDGHAHPLMLQPALELAWYNGHRGTLEFLQGWSDAWAAHTTLGEYPTLVNVPTERVVDAGPSPLSGGYGGQASAAMFLYDLTGDERHIGPFMDVLRAGRDDWPARRFVPDLHEMGTLDGLDTRDQVLRGNPITRARALGDREALCAALEADIAELQRFRTIYTDAEVFTDRVFLDALTHVAQCYLGGFATRNKYHHTHAVSWEGFGADYAALVLSARRDGLVALVYNFADRPLAGSLRLWRLGHGVYELAQGVDADFDDVIDSELIVREVEVLRGTRIPIELQPKVVTVLRLTQSQALPDERLRPDLAVSARDVVLREGAVEVTVHNIGALDAPATEVVVRDGGGEVCARAEAPPLEAPTDLSPRTATVALAVDALTSAGWTVEVDAGRAVEEITEDNNTCAL